MIYIDNDAPETARFETPPRIATGRPLLRPLPHPLPWPPQLPLPRLADPTPPFLPLQGPQPPVAPATAGRRRRTLAGGFPA